MINDNLSNPLGQLRSIPKKTGEQFLKEPVETIEEVEVQAGTKPPASSTTLQDKKVAGASDNTDMPSSEDTLEIIKKMYEASNTKMSVPSDKIISKVIQENPKKTPEEIQKMAATRQQLWQQQHMSTYFEPTFTPKKPTQPRSGEATAQEEEEKRKKQMEELQLQEKKKEEVKSPFVKQGTVERNPGASG